MRFPCRQFVGALVIVLMALASVAPRGYSHSHEPTVCHEHEHAHEHGAAHTHDHPACHRHCHASAEERSQAVMLSPRMHRHVFWWSLEFVLPSSTTGESGEMPSDFDGTQLSSLASSSSEAVVEITASPVVSPIWPLALMGNLAPTTPAVAYAPFQRLESNLLCDAARHERSGVLLL